MEGSLRVEHRWVLAAVLFVASTIGLYGLVVALVAQGGGPPVLEDLRLRLPFIYIVPVAYLAWTLSKILDLRFKTKAIAQVEQAGDHTLVIKTEGKADIVFEDDATSPQARRLNAEADALQAWATVWIDRGRDRVEVDR
jgi:hypothetical protein